MHLSLMPNLKNFVHKHFSLLQGQEGRQSTDMPKLAVSRRGDELFEQHEIEFLPCDVEDAADQIIVAKWILRMLAYQYGVEISFAPRSL
jgi:hypothetical protein